jgi:ABC-2 type transport system ATP-binding protein
LAIYGQNKADIDALLENMKSFNGEILKIKIPARLSKGNQKKVGIIATLIGNPEVDS